MSFTNRINVIIDIATQQAQKSLKQLRTDMKNADGAAATLKVGMKGAGDFLKQNMAQGAVVAGAALVAFGVKAVGAFTDTAKAAIDLSTKTGLAVEDASRWIALGDDFELTAEQLGSSIGKIAKDLDADKWDKYGIATRDAGGNARNANDILLDTLDVLGQTTNETERARIGTELFGRGYGSLAPLVGQTREEYEGMLAAVEDGQVITGREAKKAEKMRLAQDALADALGDVTLAVGGMVAELAPAIEGLAELTTLAVDFIGLIPDINRPFIGPENAKSTDEQIDRFLQLDEAAREAALGMKGMSGDAGELDYWLNNGAISAEKWEKALAIAEEQLTGQTGAYEAMRSVLSQVRAKLDEAKDSTDALAKSHGLAERKANDQKAAWEGLTGALDNDEAILDLADSFADLYEKWGEAAEANATGAEDAAQKNRDLQRDMIELKRTVLELGGAIDGIPKSSATEIVALIDEGAFAEAERRLDILMRNRSFTIFANAKGLGDVGYGRDGGARASGGPTFAGAFHEVNEGGKPELLEEGGKTYLLPGQNGEVTPLSPSSGRAATGGVTNVFYVTANGIDDLERQLRELTRRRGASWVPR